MNSIFTSYIVAGSVACSLFLIVSISGWHIPSYDLGFSSRGSNTSTRSSSSSRSSFFPSSGSSSGRSFGGSWGGGK